MVVALFAIIMRIFCDDVQRDSSLINYPSTKFMKKVIRGEQTWYDEQNEKNQEESNYLGGQTHNVRDHFDDYNMKLTYEKKEDLNYE